MDPQTKRRLERCKTEIGLIRKFLDELTDAKIADLFRIEAEPADPDGFPAGGTGDGSRSSDETTPTERAALRGLPEGTARQSGGTHEAVWTTNGAGQRVRTDQWHRHVPPDPVREQIQDLFTNLAEMAGHAKRSSRTLVVIHNRPELLKAKEESMNRCQACQRWVSGGDPDPDLMEDIDDPLDVVKGSLRSGYCNACRMAWDRNGKPDRPYFEKQRLERHTAAKAARPEVEHVDPVLDYIGIAQAKGILPSPSWHTEVPAQA